MKNQAEAGNQGKPETARESEGMEERQNSEQAVVAVHADGLLDAFEVRDDVTMAENDALWNAG